MHFNLLIRFCLVSFLFLIGGCEKQEITDITSQTDAPAAATATTADLRCMALEKLELPGYDLEITTVRHITSVEQLNKNRLNDAALSAFAPFCKIEGYFERRTGAQGKPYAIGFGLNLPDQWNGRFLFQGGGGLNGLIRDPLGHLATGNSPALFRGFAVASTDSGHQSDSVFNPDFLADQRALLNFYHEAVAKTTQLAKTIVQQYYNGQIDHSYFAGCSTGGREALTMSQRFPEFYDGIIAGAPARVTNYSEIADLWSAKRLQAVAEANAGKPFTETQQALIVSSLLDQCDAKDGLKDGYILDVDGCDFAPAQLQCSGDNTESCLSQGQVEALTEAFAGPKQDNGKNIYPGFYFDTGISAKGDRGIPGLLQAVPGPLGKTREHLEFDIERELEYANNSPLAPGNATLTNLSTFSGNGGKLMLFHGVSDPWFSAKDTLGYYRKMTVMNGGSDQVTNWSQFYFVPGMGHCFGGEQALDEFDMLTPLMDWVEKGEAPVSVAAGSSSTPEISRPLCPYPGVSTYLGEGDVNNPASYTCRLPENQ